MLFGTFIITPRCDVLRGVVVCIGRSSFVHAITATSMFACIMHVSTLGGLWVGTSLLRFCCCFGLLGFYCVQGGLH